MATFTVPTFNLQANLWRGVPVGNPYPPPGPPTLAFKCQLRLFRTAFLSSQGIAGIPILGLLCPARTDIRPASFGVAASDTVEVPASSGRFYRVTAVDDVARGFTNEYRLATLVTQINKQGGCPLPIP